MPNYYINRLVRYANNEERRRDPVGAMVLNSTDGGRRVPRSKRERRPTDSTKSGGGGSGDGGGNGGGGSGDGNGGNDQSYVLPLARRRLRGATAHIDTDRSIISNVVSGLTGAKSQGWRGATGGTRLRHNRINTRKREAESGTEGGNNKRARRPPEGIFDVSYSGPRGKSQTSALECIQASEEAAKIASGALSTNISSDVVPPTSICARFEKGVDLLQSVSSPGKCRALFKSKDRVRTFEHRHDRLALAKRLLREQLDFLILESVRDPRTLLVLNDMLGGGIHIDRSGIASKMKMTNKKTSFNRRGEISKMSTYVPSKLSAIFTLKFDLIAMCRMPLYLDNVRVHSDAL